MIIRQVIQLEISLSSEKQFIFIKIDVELIYIMSMNKLTTLQQFPMTDAKIMFTCRHCGISSIAANAFIDTPNILTLDLAFNELESSALFPEIFKGPEKDEIYAPIALQKLDLSHNKLTTLDKLIFEHTPDLKYLVLSHNSLQIFDDSTQWALRSLGNLEVKSIFVVIANAFMK